MTPQNKKSHLTPCQLATAMMARWLLAAIGLTALALAGADDPKRPHMHSGVFRRRKIGPPATAGFQKLKRRSGAEKESQCQVIALPTVR